MTIKRYALSLLLALFAIGGVGAYCVYAANDRMPEYRLVAIEGDTALAEGLLLSGNYGGRMHSRFVSVTSDGSSYAPERRPLSIEQLRGWHNWFLRHPGVPELVRDYRGFMRGKANPGGLYRDEEKLVYAEADALGGPALRLKLEALDLATGRSVKHTTEIPDAEGLAYAFVADVQRMGNEFHLIVRQARLLKPTDKPQQESRAIAEIRDYVIDAGSGKVVREVELEPDIDKGEARLEFEIIPTGVANSTNYAVMEVATIVSGPKGDQTTGRYLYAYDYATGRLNRLPDALTSGSFNQGYMIFMDGNSLYLLVKTKDTEIRMIHYDIDKSKLSEEIVITAGQLGVDSLANVALQGELVYLLLRKDDATQAAVLRALDGKELYRGEVEFTGPASEAAGAMADLQLYQIEIRS